ncbi:MAG: hypothetical protein R3A80_02540 [Bdellovibrionota bacterium]
MRTAIKATKKKDQLLGLLYLGASFSLAFFCLYQSHSIGHDQSARDLAGRSIHTELSSPQIAPSLLPNNKIIGEGSD